LLRSWPAIVNGTPDWKPIIGEIPGVPGFYLAMFPYLGFTAGPLAAKSIAQVILGEQPDVDVLPFSAERHC
jgi:sarcosine oxidase, subunit beta